jgi:hypothetical protein
VAERDFERHEEAEAAAEAGAIGGNVSSEPKRAGDALDEASRPLAQAGQGEAEGFEEAERDLIEHASHGDMHAARQAIEDAPGEPDDLRAASAGEADAEHSTERLGDR